MFFGLSYVFRSPRIPLAISVKDRVLEIVGLDPKSGLRTGDSNRKSGGHSQALSSSALFRRHPYQRDHRLPIPGSRFNR
jgi:hypothetical protein